VFIPVAEETGMIQEIGDWVFSEAASQAVKWRKTHHPDFQISINKSPVQFKAKESDLASWLNQLNKLNLPGQSIAVEITEEILMNDTLGHDMGDILLKEAAQRLNGCMRASDSVARLGGDEFTVILSELHDPGNVDRVARHILKTLSDPFQLGEEIVHVSASIGITLYPNDSTEIEDLIKNADQAMYAAKQEGKNRFHYFTPALQELAIAKMRHKACRFARRERRKRNLCHAFWPFPPTEPSIR